MFYYAPPSRPKGPRHCPHRGNTVGALVFFPQLLWLLYALGVYTYPKIHLAKLGSSNSTGTVPALLYHIHTTKSLTGSYFAYVNFPARSTDLVHIVTINQGLLLQVNRLGNLKIIVLRNECE